MDSILTTTSAAGETRLTEAATLKTQVSVTDSADTLDLTIKAASAEISALLAPKRDEDNATTIGRASYTETFYDLRSVEEVLVSRLPIVSVASVTKNGTQVLSDASDFNYLVKKARGAIQATVNDLPTTLSANSFTVAYTAGWLLPGEGGRNLPYDIELACILHCKDRLRRQRVETAGELDQVGLDGLGEFDFAEQHVRFKRGFSLEVLRLLQPYAAAPLV